MLQVSCCCSPGRGGEAGPVAALRARSPHRPLPPPLMPPCTPGLGCLPGWLAVVQGLADAADAGDVEAFTAAVADFDSLTRLDAWKTTLLVGAAPAVLRCACCACCVGLRGRGVVPRWGWVPAAGAGAGWGWCCAGQCRARGCCETPSARRSRDRSPPCLCWWLLAAPDPSAGCRRNAQCSAAWAGCLTWLPGLAWLPAGSCEAEDHEQGGGGGGGGPHLSSLPGGAASQARWSSSPSQHSMLHHTTS